MNIHFNLQYKRNTWGKRWEGRRDAVSLLRYWSLSLFFLGLLSVLFVTPKVSAAAVGSVEITEFMADPVIFTDENAEWIEIENKSAGIIDTTAWDINGSTISGSIILKPGARAVICRNNDYASNGNVICQGQSGFSLPQTGDTERTIQLRDETNTVVHAVHYVGSRDVTEGMSSYVHGDTITKEEFYRYNLANRGTPNGSAPVNSVAQINVHATTDVNKNGVMDYNGEPGMQNAGWTVRLYDLNWHEAPYGDNGTNEVVTTRTDSWPRPAVFYVPPGEAKFMCQVSKSGMPQSFVASVTSWVTWHEDAITNNSGRTDENNTCIRAVAMTVGQRSTHKFGNSIDSKPALGQILVTAVTDTDGDGEPDWNEAEKHQAGWGMRLYDANWQFIKSTVTNDKAFFPAWFNVEPGNYFVCEVMKPGYAQSFARTITSWTTWPESGVQNQSTISGEGQQCIQVAVSSGGVTSQLFGNKPN